MYAVLPSFHGFGIKEFHTIRSGVLIILVWNVYSRRKKSEWFINEGEEELVPPD